MIIELISVGTELLLGDILNTNAQFLSQTFAQLGYDIYHSSVVGDNYKRLYDGIDLAMKRSDLIILTGGLGSTSDDITKKVVIDYVGRETYEDEESKKVIEDFFSHDTALEENRMTYTFPKNSKVFVNENGLASGAYIPVKDKAIVILPGPPKELKPMVEHSLQPFLAEMSSTIIKSKLVRMAILGEYQMYNMFQDEIDHSSNPTYAPYAKDDGALIRVTAKGSTEEEADQLIEEGVNKLRKVYGEYIVEIGNREKKEVLIDLLKERNELVATAESITGGQISSFLIDVAGASEAIEAGFTVYSDKAKFDILGVDRDLITKYSAVSYQVAESMVKCLASKTNSTLQIISTGYAGPSGEDVGHVYIGIGYHNHVDIFEYHMKGSRNRIRNKAANLAIDHAIMVMNKAGANNDKKN